MREHLLYYIPDHYLPDLIDYFPVWPLFLQSFNFIFFFMDERDSTLYIFIIHIRSSVDRHQD